MSADEIDLLCEHCGQTFSKFLHEMAEKNLKVVCPNCACDGTPTEAAKPAVGTPSVTKATMK